MTDQKAFEAKTPEAEKSEPAAARAPKKPNWKSIISTALFVAFLGLLAKYVWENREDMQKMLDLSGTTILWLLVLAFLGCMVNCCYHLMLLRTYGLPLTLVDWMGVVCVSNAIAYVLPLRADLVFSATYYKRAKGLAYTKSVSMAAGNIVFGVAFSLLQILAALLCMGLFDGVWPQTLWALGLIGTALLAAFIVFALVFQNRIPQFLKKYKIVCDIIEGFTALLRNRALLWQLLLCLIANNLVQLLLYMVCFRAIGLPVQLYHALFYSSTSWLSSIVAIVPGNIGIKESVMGAATLLLGISFQTGVAVSLLQRVAVMVVYLLMGLVFAIPVYRNFTRKSLVPEK